MACSPRAALLLAAGVLFQMFAFAGVASAQTGGACLYALDPSADRSFEIAGAQSVYAACGIVVESSKSDAFEMEGTETLYLQNHARVSVVGGADLTGQTEMWDTISNQQVNAVQIGSPGDPLASIAAPTSGTIVSSSPVNYDMNHKPANDTLSPGVYCGGLTIGNTNGATFTLNPGTYVMAGGGLTMNSEAVVEGTGVTVYNTSSSGWGCSGSYSYTPITISGEVTANLSAPTTGSLAGMLLFGNRTGCSTKGSCQDQINGGSTAVLNGALYFASDQLTITGSNASGYMMLVADKIYINGNSDFGNNGDPFNGITVTVAPSTATLYAGQTQQFAASVTNTGNPAVTWTISPSSIGSISSSGLYTAPSGISAQQTVTVTATSQADNTRLGTATVTLMPPVLVSVAPASAILYAGQTQQYAATVTNASNTAVAWTISPAGTGSISAAGLYTAPTTVSSQQTVTVTATSEANPAATSTATVTLDPPIAVSVTPATATLYASQTQQFAATVTNTSNTAVMWTISPTGTGTISAAGLYTAPATIASQQTITVTAASQANPAATSTATVTLYPPVALSVTPATATLYANQTQQFAATVTNTGNTAVTWTISPTGTGTISAAGLYTAPTTVSSQQTVTVTATSEANPAATATATVTLYPPITVSVTPATATLYATQTQQFAATVTNTGNTAVTWTISPAGMGAISTAGVYTAPATVSSQQTVTVTATSEANPAATATATVTLSPAQCASTGFGYVRTIVIDHTKVPNTDQVSFPLMVKITDPTLASTANGGHVSSANGYDIYFSSDPQGATVLNHEIESYDPVAGQLAAWVQIPTVSHSADTVVYMFYGNPAITTPLANPAAVWDAHYMGVWHLGNGSLLSLADSTANADSATNNGAGPIPSPLGGGMQTSGGSFATIGTPSNLANLMTQGATLSAWVEVGPGAAGVVMGKDDANATGGWVLSVDNNQFVHFVVPFGGSDLELVSANPIPTGSWVSLAVAVTGNSGQGTTATLYVNGAVSATATGGNGAPADDSGDAAYLANAAWGGFSGNAPLTGASAEFRISNTARSADWIAAEFSNQSSPSTFFTLGAENAHAVVPGTVALSAGQTQQFVLPQTGGCTAAGPVWSIAPSGAGSVSATGLYTAPATVSAQQTVTVTAANAATGAAISTASVTLMPPVVVTVTPATATVDSAYQQQQQFAATVMNASNPAVAWSVSPTWAGNITANGLYTETDFGDPEPVTITAASVQDPTKSASAMVTVQQSSVNVTPNQVSLDEGQTQQFTVQVVNNGNTTQSWQLQGGGTLSSSGLYTAPATLTTTEYVYVETYGPAGSANAFVVLNPPSVQITPAAGTVGSGQSLQFSAAVLNATNTAVTWSLNGVGTLSPTGVYTAPASFTPPQTVTVTATSQENPAISATVTIALATPSINVTPQAASLYQGDSETFVATVNYSSNTAVTWAVSPAGAGTVSSTGVYTAPATVSSAQSVTLTATSQANAAISASATITLLPGQCSASAYSYRRTIVIDHTQVPNTDQANFPFLFNTTDPSLATTANGGHVTSPAGNDIIFSLDPAGATKLDHELEEYDPVAGQVIAWVRVPNLSHTQDTVLYVFYGNANVAGPQQNPTGVWDSNFVGVWHVPNGTTLSLADSTLNGNNATDNGATATAGQIDGGMLTNGTTYATVGSQPGLGNLAQGNATFSLWVNPSASSYVYGGLMGKDYPGWSLGLNGGSPEFALPADNLWFSSGASLNPGTWSYVTVTLSGTGGAGGTATPQATMYVNGQLVGTVAGNPGPIPDDSATVAYVGAAPSAFGSNTVTGSEDEFRISNIIRSPDWIATEYNNQSAPSNFYALGTENAQQPVPTAITLYAGQSQQFVAPAAGTCSAGTVNWSVTPANAGTVTAAGLYTAPTAIASQQAVTLTATSATDGSTLGTSAITLMPPLTVSITPGSATIQDAYLQQQFTASVTNATNTAVNWTINPAGAGSVDPTGLYIAPGDVSAQQTVTVTATSEQDSTKSASATVTLLPTVSLNVNPNFAQINAGQTIQLSASVTNLSDPSVTWSVVAGQGACVGCTPPLQGDLGTVSSTGLYTAPASVTEANAGFVYVVATSNSDPNASNEAFVVVSPNQVNVNPSSAVLYNGQTQLFTASLNGVNITGVTWSVSGPGTISAAGLYSAPAVVPAGATVTITATPQGIAAIPGTATITLQPSTLQIAPGLANLFAGQTQQLTAALAYGGSTPITWSISPAGIGAISAAGLYTAPASVASEQTVTVTAISEVNAAVTATSTINVSPGECASSGYGYVRSIVIDHTQVPNTDQKDFPFLFSSTDPGFASTASGGHMASAAANDLMFSLDPGGSTSLPYELEQYNPATGQVIAWIQLPTLSHTTDTVIYVFYGNPAITAPQQNPSGVWDSTYAGVWHLANGTQLSLADSTTNGNNGTDNGATATAGEIDGGMQTTTSTGAEVPGSASLANLPQGKATFSAWVNPTASSNTSWIMGNLGSNTGWGLEISYGNPQFEVEYNNGYFVAAPNTGNVFFGGEQPYYSIPSGTWSYITVTLDGDATAGSGQQPTATFYVNGIPIRTLSQAEGQGPLNDDTSNPLYFGANPYNGLAGDEDELRVSNVIRSADWIAAEYRNQSAPSSFYALTAENIQGPEPATISLYGGQSQQFSVPGLGSCAAGPVTWTVSPAGAGTLTSTGVYSAPATITQPQTVTVTATNPTTNAPLGSAMVNLQPPVSVVVTPGSVTYSNEIFANYKFSAAVSNAKNTGVIWSVDPPSAGVIDSTGTMVTTADTTTTPVFQVVATSVQDPTKVGTATVTYVPQPSMSIAPGNVTLTSANQQQQFSASIANVTNSGVVWSISPAGIGTITQNGLYTAPPWLVGQPSVTVTATSTQYSGLSATANVSFSAGLAITPASVSLFAGNAQQFSASNGGFAIGVNWSVSPANAGTINAAGLYVAPLSVTSQQTVTVTATDQDDSSQTASAQITLNPSACAASGYTHVRTIVIDHRQVPSTDQSNFPFLFNSTDSAFASVANGGFVASSAGNDLFFSSDPNGVTKLDFELEEYNPVTGQVVAWIRIPQLSHTTDTVLYMFYGNANVTASQQNPAAVWDSNYLSVYHLANGQSATAMDSTVNGNQATLTSVTAVRGEIDGAGGFNGSSSMMQVPAAALPAYPAQGQSGNFTGSIGVWFNTTASGTIIDQATAGAEPNGSSGAADALLYVDNTGYLHAGLYFEAQVVSPSTYNDGQWHFAYLTYNNGGQTLYVDGQNIGSTQGYLFNFAPAYSYFVGAGPSSGSGPLNGWSWFTGSIDEVTASSSVRSSDWIATEYNNQHAPSSFYTLYADQGAGVSLSPPQVNLYAGQGQQFTALEAGACSAPPVLWSIPAGAPGTLSSGGLYSAPASIAEEQTVPVTATTFGDNSTTHTATVTLLPPVAVSVSPATASMIAAGQQQFTATVSNAANTAVTWTVSPANLGTINATGLFTATAQLATQQSVTVTAISSADATKSAAATVNLLPAIDVGISPADTTLYPGQTQQFAAAVVNSDDTDVVWTVSPAGAGTISSSGVYTAPATISSQQSVTITATSVADSAQSASATVNLLPPACNVSSANGYSYSRAIVIRHAQVPGADEVNFPVLISGTYPYLATSANGGRLQNANGYDVIFTSDAAGQNPLNYEIDSYNPLNGTVAYWVQLPYVSHTADTIFYMWYGNPAVTSSQENKTAVWSNGYAGVWHFGNGTTLSTADSTANANNGVNNDVTPASGWIGGAGSFDGTGNTYLDIPSSASYKPATAITLEAWVNMAAPTNWPDIFSLDYQANGSWNSPYQSYALDFSGGSLEPRLDIAIAGNQNAYAGPNNIATGQWTHIAGTYDGNNMIVYANGVAVSTTPVSGPIDYGTSLDLDIGSRSPYTSAEAVDGLIDEARISTVARSSSWIAAEYNNESSPSTFYSILGENGFFVAPGNAVLFAGQSQQFTVGASCNSGVNWSLSTGAPGTITQDGLYTAPAAIDTQQTVTVTAASQADPSQTATATITLQAQAVGISVSPANANLTANQTQQFTAIVTNTTNTAVTWSIGPNDPGSISADGVYSAPSAVTAPQTVTVTATSVADPTQSATATVSLSPGQCASVGYGYQRAIVIDHTKVPNTDQANFPFLFNSTDPELGGLNYDGHVASPNGYDIFFSLDPNGQTKLDHEVEQYNPQTGQLVAWIRIPTLSHTTDTTIYMFYGNPDVIAPQANPAGVWDNDYQAVYHLGALGNGSVPDSTAYGNTGSVNALTPAAGMIDGGAGLNGVSSYLQIPNGAFPNYPTGDYANFGIAQTATTTPFNATVGLWFRTSEPGNLIAQTDGEVCTNYFFVCISYGPTQAGDYDVPGGFGLGIGENGTMSGSGITTSTTYLDNRWHYAVMTYQTDGTDTLYVDGAVAGVAQGQIPAGYASNYAYFIGTGDSILDISGQGTWNWMYFGGALDEVNVSDIARSGDWIRTEYNNQSSPSTFYTLYSPTAPAVVPSSVSLYASQTQQFAVAGTCNIGVTWSLSGNAPGELSTTGLYAAPPMIAASQNLSVTATNATTGATIGTAAVSLLPTPAPITLAAAAQSPYPTATTQAFTATLLDASGDPEPEITVNFSVTGANATTGSATTDLSGVATWSYTGNNSGMDTVQASAVVDGTAYTSNTVGASWVVPVQNPAGAVRLLVQDSLGRGGLIGAFTDSTGSVIEPVAIGASARSFIVPAGATQFQLGINDTFYSDNGGSGFLVAVNGQQVTVPPTAMPWTWTTGGLNNNYQYGMNNGTSPVVAATGLAAGQIVQVAYQSGTISASYPSRPLTNADGDQTIVTGAVLSYGVYYPTEFTTSAAYPAGQPIPVSALVTSSSGAPMANVPVILNVAGANPGQYQAVTDASGTADFLYTGTYIGADTLGVQATVSGNTTLTSSPAIVNWITPQTPGPLAKLSLTFFATDVNLQAYVVLAKDASGNIVNQAQVGFYVYGVDNFQTLGTTDLSGQTTMYYYHPESGPFNIVAVATINGNVVMSNVISGTWTEQSAGSSNGNNSISVSISAPTSVSMPNSAQLSGTATDNVGINPTYIWNEVSGPGTVTFSTPQQATTAASFDAPGVYVIQLTASDTGVSAAAETSITVTPYQITQSNQGQIGSPLNDSTVTGIVPISLAPGMTIESGTLTYFPTNNINAVTTLNGNVSGTGQIGTLDTTMLANQSYWIRMQGTDTGGNAQNALIMVTVAGNYKPGRVTASVTDLVVPATGLAISIQRQYDSLNAGTVGDFGYGWNLSTNVDLTVDPKGNVTFTLGGQRRTFYLTPQAPPCTIAGCLFPYYFAAYTPEPGFYGTLSDASSACPLDILSPDGSLWLCYQGTGVYSPTAYQYTDANGTQYLISADGNLRSVTDKNGNSLSITPNGITSSSGLNVPFVRDAQGRITQITDPQGNQYLYSYDENGNLATVTYPNTSQPSTYTYAANHYYTDGTDFRSNPLPTTAYYGPGDQDPNGLPLNGRLQSTTDALGETTSYAYDLATNTTTITYPPDATGAVGHATMTYDSYGMLLSSTDPLSETTTNAYDANHNLISATDPLGHTTTYSYDTNGNRTSTTYPATATSTNTTSSTVYNQYSEPTSTTDELGNVRTFYYDANLNPQNVVDSLGTLASFIFSPNGQMQAGAIGFDITQQPTMASQFTYDANGNLASRTDALGRTTSYTYNNLGQKLTMTVPLLSGTSAASATTTYTYDPLGNLTQTAAPLGRTTGSTFDANGNKLTDTDANGNVTHYTYDALNRLTLTKYPDGSTVSNTYDFRNNVVDSVDQDGHDTHNVYDLAGRLTSVTRAYGTASASTASYTYDNAGRKLTQTDGVGAVTTYTYDNAGNLVSVSGPGGTFQYAYDNARNRISVTDGNNHTTQYQYDARKRQTVTTYPDGTTSTNAYDGPGNLASVTDQGGRQVQYTYDAANQLHTVVQLASPNTGNNTNTYGYDPDSNLVSLSDENGHTTQNVFNLAYEQVSKTLPDATLTETRTYDNNGNLATVTHFSGVTTTYSYDSLNRLLSRATPGEVTVTHSYTLTGKYATTTDASGTTSYNYDSMDRLTSKVTPEGTLGYTYDADGHVLSIASSNANGASMSYTYDSLSRLSTVTDGRNGGVTTYTYDPANNLATAAYPNNTQATFQYDPLNRLTGMATNTTGYLYDLGPTGIKTGATESNGRTLTWSFDGIYRLTSENITNDPSKENGSVGYDLDPVGNRLTETSSLTGISSGNFSYNTDDQLSGEMFDPNGNVTETGGKTFAYDSQNELVSMNNGAVSIVYDGFGSRVAKTVNGVTTRYLVDDLNPTGYPQVVDELTNGVVSRTYTYGLQRIDEDQVVNNAWTPSFYGYDGFGTVRQLTNASGAVTDSFEFDSFGNQITHTGTTPNNYLYRGEAFDSDLGLYYLRARWMNPTTGRFLSRDPDNGVITDPATLHKYLYAEGDPVDFGDPSGRNAVVVPGQWSPPKGSEYAGIALVMTLVAIKSLPHVEEGISCLLDKSASTLAGIAAGPIWEIKSISFGECDAKVKRDKCDPGEDNHHMLPQQFVNDFNRCNIPDIDAPQFMRCVKRDCHTGPGGLHSNQNGRGTSWNGRWARFWDEYPGGKCPSIQTVINFMDQLEQEFAKQFICAGDDEE
jgi:RHS repeat-associated protein